MTQQFLRDGYCIVGSVLDPRECEAIADEVGVLDPAAGGTRRMLEQPWCRALAARLAAHPVLAQLIGADSVAVQCTFFEKSAERNWLVPVHQDLSIPVAARVDHPQLSGWSMKEGVWYVRGPVPVLDRMAAVRVHLDDCGAKDGPLRIVPGSHLGGILTDSQAIATRDAVGETVCTADKGSVLVMRPLVLHASSKGAGDSRRRVLHFMFGPKALPAGLAWPATSA